MKRTLQRTFPQWQGFELAPQGYLLEQLVDLRGEMGLAYERMVEFRKDFHVHDRLSLVCPRGACVVRVRSPDNSGGHVIASGVLLVIPAGHPHDLTARSSIFDTVALYPSAALLERVSGEERVPASALARFRKTLRALRRSPWLDQLLVEYFSRRVLALRTEHRRAGAALRFFETELMREVFRIAGLWQESENRDDGSPSNSSVSDLALQYIEANLFAPLHVQAIARHAHASVSTLLRRFSERTGTTPLKYARNRRLDEAKALLKSDAHSITQIAILVGYENPGAFCEAFRTKFGESPSRARGKL